MNAIIYEWDVETVTSNETDKHEANEVLDHDFQTSYATAKDAASGRPMDGCHHEIVLICNEVDRRSWAYVVDGKLPEFFEDANGDKCRKVPARFHAEIK